MSKVFITGGCGFIGSHLVELCVDRGFNVVVFDRYNPNNDWGWLEASDYKDDIEVILGDVRDYDSVSKAMAGCGVVFHLAALIGIPFSYVSPLAYVRTNVEGTYNILEAAKNLGVDQILITSTSETYGSAQYIPIDEQHPLVGQSPYSATKIAADQLAISYFMSFELPVKVVRPFNTYGPRQSARAVIPTVITQVLSGREVIKLGNLTPTRDLTFVRDTCTGFLEIYKAENFFGGVTNIGMNREISIGDLAEKIIGIMGSNTQIIQDQERLRPEQSEVDRLICNNEKILKRTDWEPKYDLDKGLRETINWFKETDNVYKPQIYNL